MVFGFGRILNCVGHRCTPLSFTPIMLPRGAIYYTIPVTTPENGERR
jgi:hypothetical protein